MAAVTGRFSPRVTFAVAVTFGRHMPARITYPSYAPAYKELTPRKRSRERLCNPARRPVSAAPAVSQPPPTPWSLQFNAYGQIHLITVDAARRVVPAEVSLLSVGGGMPLYVPLPERASPNTMGMIFFVDYASSPFGPFREVDIIQLLTFKGTYVGAWASHVLVTSPLVAEHARDVFGLPTQVTDISYTPHATSEQGFVFVPGAEEGQVDAVSVRLPTPPGRDTGSWQSRVHVDLHPMGLTMGNLSGALPILSTSGRAAQGPLMSFPLTFDQGLIKGALPVPVDVRGAEDDRAWLEPLVCGTGVQIPLATWFERVTARSGPVSTF
mmetsp:Transcript_11329/g.41454  ORF Transcript_11329/g.41454 Transcript_11329/m.41454 type:complete len:325 (-) Transcript_11329:278-1252(-)